MAKWPYNTQRWKRLRAAKLRETPLCEYCQPVRITPAREVDHRHAINLGGDPWAWDNLASSCEDCHKSKTVADKLGVPWERKGCAADGTPLDAGHWWNTTPAQENLSELKPGDRVRSFTQS